MLVLFIVLYCTLLSPDRRIHRIYFKETWGYNLLMGLMEIVIEIPLSFMMFC